MIEISKEVVIMAISAMGIFLALTFLVLGIYIHYRNKSTVVKPTAEIINLARLRHKRKLANPQR